MASDEELNSIDLLTNEQEPWQEWESRIVILGFAVAITSIVILGWLINSYILP